MRFSLIAVSAFFVLTAGIAQATEHGLAISEFRCQEQESKVYEEIGVLCKEACFYYNGETRFTDDQTGFICSHWKPSTTTVKVCEIRRDGLCDCTVESRYYCQ